MATSASTKMTNRVLMVRVVAFQYGEIKLWRADDIRIMAVRRLRRRRSCAVLPASNAGAAGAAPGPRERVLLWLRTTRTALLTRRRGGWDVFVPLAIVREPTTVASHRSHLQLSPARLFQVQAV